MKNVRASIKWIVSIVAAVILAAFLEPHIVSYLAESGWYEDPRAVIAPVSTWISRLIGDQAFQSTVAGLIGFCFGVWTHWIASKMSSHLTAKDNADMYYLSVLIGNYCGKLRALLERHDRKVFKRDFDISIEIRQEYKSIQSKLRKYGITTYDLSNLSGFDFLASAIMQFEYIISFLKEGQIKEARNESKLIYKKLDRIIKEEGFNCFSAK